jgi:hypothetical protein
MDGTKTRTSGGQPLSSGRTGTQAKTELEWATRPRQCRLLALLRPKQPAVRVQALAGVACRRRQKKYDTPQRTPVPTGQLHASTPSPTARWATSAETSVMAKPA